MITIVRTEPAEPAWSEWRKRAQAATCALVERVESGAKPDIDDRIYKDAMQYLLALSREKCAYCESSITTTHSGDVEHYRPKGRIKDHVTGKVIRLPDDSDDHPGYWWLAYEWKNLLPSCIDCNRRRWHDNEQGGKGELFPLCPGGNRAVKPGDEKDEDPLLLNPMLPDFKTEDHLKFHANGLISPLSDKGTESCRIFGLNLREPLVVARRQRFKEAIRAFSQLLTKLTSDALREGPMPEDEIELRREINQMWTGEQPYGACTREALRYYADALSRKGVPVKLPLEIPV